MIYNRHKLVDVNFEDFPIIKNGFFYENDGLFSD